MLITLFLAVVFSDSDARHSGDSLADRCIEIYANELPKDIRVRLVRQDGQNLIVYIQHLDWTGEVSCTLHRDDSLDEIATLTRGSEVRWTEPGVPATP